MLLFATACNDDPQGPVAIEDEVFPRNLNVDLSTMTRTSTGLYYKDEVVGSGAVAGVGDDLTVEYTGWLTDGRPFDSGTFTVTNLGNANVIDGWNEGLVGLRVGGKRLLVIPYTLGYGVTGNGPIPPYANLVFRVELKSLVDR